MPGKIIIPARWASTRFTGKPLTMIKGADGYSKPMIQRTYEIAVRAIGLSSVVDDVYIATDSHRIADVCRDFGAKVLMTSNQLRNGTERCAEAARGLGMLPDDLVINLQGDACITPPMYVATLASAFSMRSHGVGTLVQPASPHRNQVYVDITENFRAITFSRAALPQDFTLVNPARYRHLGVYAYRVSALDQYDRWPPTLSELAEGLEQLRFIGNGMPVYCVEALPHRHVIEVNYPEDVAAVEKEMVHWNIK